MSDTIPAFNSEIALGLIREELRLPPQASPSDIVAQVRAMHATITASPGSKDDVGYHFHQIVMALGLDPFATMPPEVLAAVRKTKAAADLAKSPVERHPAHL